MKSIKQELLPNSWMWWHIVHHIIMETTSSLIFNWEIGHVYPWWKASPQAQWLIFVEISALRYSTSTLEIKKQFWYRESASNDLPTCSKCISNMHFKMRTIEIVNCIENLNKNNEKNLAENLNDGDIWCTRLLWEYHTSDLILTERQAVFMNQQHPERYSNNGENPPSIFVETGALG